MFTRRSTILAIWVILLLASSAVLSAEMPPSGQCGYMCHVPMAYQGGSSAMAPRGLRPLEGDFSQMKTRFGIRPAQEAAWTNFAKVVSSPMPDPHETMKSAPPRSSVERAKFMEELWRQRHDHMQAVTKAFKELYNMLDDDQKRVADQRFGYCELVR